MRALVVRRAALGDFVLTLPVIRALAALGPVHVATHARYAPLLPPGAVLVDDAWLWRGEPPPHPYTDGFAFGETAAEALRAAGLRVHAVAPRPPPGVHAVAHYAGVLDGIALPEPLDLAPRVSPPPAALAAARADAAVVIAPGSGGREKRWPLARFRALADALAARGLPVAWVRGPDEDGEPGWPADARCPDLLGLVGLAATCRAWVGPDAGPSHLAAAVRSASSGEPAGDDEASAPWGGVTGGPRPPVPRGSPADVHVIFGPTDPACWGPVGAVCWPWDVDPIGLAEAIHRV